MSGCTILVLVETTEGAGLDSTLSVLLSDWWFRNSSVTHACVHSRAVSRMCTDYNPHPLPIFPNVASSGKLRDTCMRTRGSCTTGASGKAAEGAGLRSILQCHPSRSGSFRNVVVAGMRTRHLDSLWRKVVVVQLQSTSPSLLSQCGAFGRRGRAYR